MKYEDRKVCGLINLHTTTNPLRCPVKPRRAVKDADCMDCELFETYLNFKELSIQLRNSKNLE